ncbi:MAG: TlpA family protein disulfide reductase [Beijerinckiaceae bacterium]
MAQQDDETAQTSAKRQGSGFGRTAAVVAVAICAGAAILYGITGGPGKDGPPSAADPCAASAATAGRIDPIAKGELAALAVPKSPKPATDISFEGPDGKKLSLKDFQGKTILLNLWATWCVPCRAEMPALDRLQAALGSDRFEVVAVNIDTSRLERRKPFLDSVGVKHLKFYTDKEAQSFQVLKQAGKVLGLPSTFLIDGKGCEIGRMAGPAEWDSERAQQLIRASLPE